ncbi:MAG: AraC family transcriptional regulator [Bacilli bacterium]
MSDVREVFITAEVSNMLNMTPAYLIRTAKSMNLSKDEFREAGKRNYLFSESAVKKLKIRFHGDKKE